MKKFLIFLVVFVAAFSFVYSRYSVQDIVEYAHAKADPRWSAMVEYYAGYYYVMKNRNAEAIQTLEAMIEAYPESPYRWDATFRLGNAYEALKNYPKAKELYESYLAEQPNGPYSQLARRKLEIFKSM